MASEIKYVDITVHKETQVEDGVRLITTLRPDWASDQIKHKVLTAGYINCMMSFHLEEDPEEKHALIVRKYGDIGVDLIPRDMEFLCMQLAGIAGTSKPVVGVFNNGFVYERAAGRNLEWRDYLNPDILRKLGRAIAQLHFTDPKSVSLVDRKGIPTTWPTEFHFDTLAQTTLDTTPEHLKDPEKDKRYQSVKRTAAERREDLDFVKALLDELSLEPTPSHNDTHMKNTIYDDETGELFLVDYDGGSNGYAIFDLSYIVFIWSIREYVGWTTPNDPETIDKPEIRRCLVTSYLERRHELLGRSADDVTEEEIQHKLVEFEIFYILCYYVFGSFMPVLADDVKFDAIGCIGMCYDYFLSNKHRLEGLKQEFCNHHS